MASSAAEEETDEGGHIGLRAAVFYPSGTWIWVSWGRVLRSLLLQSTAEKLLLVEANPSRPETMNSVFLSLNVIPYIRSYIIPELGLIVANPKDNDVLILPVLICIVSCTYLSAKLVFFPHVFVPSEQYLWGEKNLSSLILWSILCTLNYLLQSHYKIRKILHCNINLFMVLFFLIYSSLHFCIFLDHRFWDQII